MKTKSVIYLAPILLLCLTFCGKSSKEKKMTGTWEKINVYTQTPDFVEYWKFDSDGTVTRHQLPTGGSIAEVDNGTWEIVQKIDKAFVNMEFVGIESKHEDYNNAWRIYKLKKDIMILIFIEDGQKTIEFKSSNLF